MSQAKVDRYKQEKRNRKQIMAREKRQHIAVCTAGCVLAAAIVGWAGYSGYRAYQNSRPLETIYVNLDSINDYMTQLNAD